MKLQDYIVCIASQHRPSWGGWPAEGQSGGEPATTEAVLVANPHAGLCSTRLALPTRGMISSRLHSTRKRPRKRTLIHLCAIAQPRAGRESAFGLNPLRTPMDQL